MKVKGKVKSLSRVRPSATSWTAAFQAPPSMGFSRQEYWRGVPLPSPGLHGYCMFHLLRNSPTIFQSDCTILHSQIQFPCILLMLVTQHLLSVFFILTILADVRWYLVVLISICLINNDIEGFPGGAVVKNLPPNAGDTRESGSIPGLGRSPSVGNGNPLQYSCLENSKDRGAWQAIVRRVTKSQTRLSTQSVM